MRPVYTPIPYWVNIVGNNKCGAGPLCIVACCMEGPKTIVEAELHYFVYVEAITCISTQTYIYVYAYNFDPLL